MASQTPKSVHKRFADSDSDSPETFHDSNAELVPTPPKHNEAAKISNIATDGDANPDSDSDSDAPPEAVSASTALEATRSAAKRAAATRRHATEAERAKRQQFDAARVKEIKSRRNREAQEKETEAEAQALAEPADTNLPEFSIPDELPAEVIAAAEQERTAKSRQGAEKLATREAERLLKEQRQAARTLKLKQYLRGPKTKTSARQPGSSNTVIRVLPKASAALPPRSTRREQIAREHFLKGPGAGGSRRGRGGRVEKGDSSVGRRKPWKSGFVVK